MLEMFMDEECADVVFEVEDEQQAHIKFHAHRVILKRCAPMLAELSAGPGVGVTSVPISGIKPEIFRHILHYVYGGKVAGTDLKTHAKGIIGAANRFGVMNLKLEAEASYVKSTTISVDNVMEHLLYARYDMDCALLKEVVFDFILENGSEVLQKVSLKDAPGGLLVDLYAATTREIKKCKDLGGNSPAPSSPVPTFITLPTRA
ncbi:hypothetical protein ACHAXR_012294 [Thalassiosira sp. AJA248-18]